MPRVQASDSEKTLDWAACFSMRAFYPIRRGGDSHPLRVLRGRHSPERGSGLSSRPMSRRPNPPLLQLLPLLSLAVLALPGCMMYARMRMALDPPEPPPPTQIRFDPYGALEPEAAYAAFAETK